MDHEIRIIHQDPLCLPVPLDVVGGFSGFLQSDFDFVGDRLDLGGRMARANDEVIGKGRHLPEIQNDEIERLLVPGGLERMPEVGIVCFQKEPLAGNNDKKE